MLLPSHEHRFHSRQGQGVAEPDGVRFAEASSPEACSEHLVSWLGLAGLAVIAAMSTRAVLHHEDAGVTAAPLVAAVSIGAGLLLAFRGRFVPVAVGAGLATYLVLAAALPSPL